MRVHHHGESDVGLCRAHNEDAFLADPELGLFVVADGVGGRAKGEVASSETVELVWDWIKREQGLVRDISTHSSPETVSQLCRLVRNAIQNACYLVNAMGEFDPDQRGMSTTASAILICGNVGIVGQVGDSRVYLSRKGTVSQLTEDHTLINYQLKHGLITEGEAARSNMKNVITRAIGHREYVEVDTLPIPLFGGDRVLLCSDGFHGYVTDVAEVGELLSNTVDGAVRECIRFANEKGGKDNITALLIELADE